MSRGEWRGGELEWGHWERLFQLRLRSREKERGGQYLERLIKWRTGINLTARSSVGSFLQFDFFESFWLADHFLEGAQRVVDVGSGAGFPGLVVKIRCPELEVILVEPNYKRVVFLRESARSLQLEVECVHGRGEDFSGWRPGDIATLRALRPSRELLRLLWKNKVSLACLHGRSCPGPLAALQPRLSLPVPGSEQRFASLFEWRSLRPEE